MELTLARPAAEPDGTPFASAPFIVIWEVTRACALACVHCRAEALPRRHPDELTTEEGKRLIDRVSEFGPRRPLLVLTGGDPLRRRDVADLVRHGVDSGLSVGLTPSGTAAVTRPRLEELRDAGLGRLAVSLDGSSAAAHDAFRGVRGSHRYTMRIVDDARDSGCRSRSTRPSRARPSTTYRRSPRSSNGRRRSLGALLPHPRRACAHRARARRRRDRGGPRVGGRPSGPGPVRDQDDRGAALSPRARGTARRRAGGGRPRGARGHGRQRLSLRRPPRLDLPERLPPPPAGNVRTDDLIDVYREHPTFLALRDPDRLRGRCGACEFRTRCGGSRARAYAATGDPLAEDPGCAHVPGG